MDKWFCFRPWLWRAFTCFASVVSVESVPYLWRVFEKDPSSHLWYWTCYLPEKALYHLHSQFYLQSPPSIETQDISGLSFPVKNLHLFVPLTEQDKCWDGGRIIVFRYSQVGSQNICRKLSSCAGSPLTSSLPCYWLDGAISQWLMLNMGWAGMRKYRSKVAASWHGPRVTDAFRLH